MPYVKIQTNRTVDDELKEKLLPAVSSLAAAALEKPERWVMTALEDGVSMTFGGDKAPCAFLP